MSRFMYCCSSVVSIIASEASQPPAGTRFMTRSVKKTSSIITIISYELVHTPCYLSLFITSCYFKLVSLY